MNAFYAFLISIQKLSILPVTILWRDQKLQTKSHTRIFNREQMLHTWTSSWMGAFKETKQF